MSSTTYISTFTATYLSSTSITLAWSGSYDTVTLKMTTDRINYTTLASNITTTSYTVTGLSVGRRYYFTITPNKKTNLLYSKSENGLQNTYLSVNGGTLFTNVYGLASNSGYGFAPPANAIYLKSGDKMSITTPRSYPYGMRTGDVEISVDLNTFPASF